MKKSWIGKSKNFRKDPNNGKEAIRFEVSDLKEVSCPTPYKNYKEGWHLNKSSLFSGTSAFVTTSNQNLQPSFFSEMSTCNWQLFEEHCFYLLRLLGIHELHKFPQSDNRGKADGFFKFSTLSVLYDATLYPLWYMYYQ